MRTLRGWLCVFTALLLVTGMSGVAGAQSSIEPLVTLSAEGGQPLGSLMRDSRGDLVGSTSSGGVYGRGSIYRLTAASSFTQLETIYSFRGPDGQLPRGELIELPDGHFYGVTTDGGAAGIGTVYRLDVSTTPASVTVLWSFNGGALGYYPAAGLVDAGNGHLYGGTIFGGGIFDVDLTASPVTVTLAADLGASNLGGIENRLLKIGDAFFGTSPRNGEFGYGAIFRFDPGLPEPVTVLHSFTDWANPYSGLVEGPDGLLYGANGNGGASNVGSIFRFDPGASPVVVETVASFDYSLTGGSPHAPLFRLGSSLFGVTHYGGVHGNGFGGGAVFRLDLGPTPQLSVVQSLDPRIHGSTTYAGPTAVGSLLYLPVNADGPFGTGSIIAIDPAVPESATVVHAFGYGRETGATLIAGLLETEPGVFFGATIEGGAFRKGTLYRLDTRVTPATHEVVYSFSTPESALPLTALVMGSDGLVYGGTAGAPNGGSNGGAIFRFNPAISPVQVEIVHLFTSRSVTDLTAGIDGRIYGVTENGGPANRGTIFRIDPAASPIVEDVHLFDDPTMGSVPFAAPIQLADGRLVGTTLQGGEEGRGTVYSLQPTSPGSFVREFSFRDDDLHTMGGWPFGLTQTAAGRIVGMTFLGYGNTSGGLFEIDPSTAPMTVIGRRNVASGQGRPSLRLARGSTGELYGTFDAGGSYNGGFLYRIDPVGAGFQLQGLVSFNPSVSGQYPTGGVVQGSDGRLYGTTQAGGQYFGGVIYRVTTIPLAVQLLTPNGGERVTAGVERTISWTVTGDPGSATVEISRNNGATWSAVPGCQSLNGSQTSCQWTPSGPATTMARVRVTVQRGAQPAVTDASDAPFTISTAAPSITVTAPNTAVTWSAGTTRTITWNHNFGAETSFRVSISRDGGASWTTLTNTAPAATATTGAFPWVVTGPDTTSALIRVQGVSVGSDVSNVAFTITAPTIIVTAPNTAVTWQSGTTRTIAATHNLGASQPVAIELSRDNGGSWTLLATVTTTASSTVSYPWTVSGPATSQALVRARWTAAAGVADTSDVPFTIRALVTLQAPNTAVSWAAGSLRTVSWIHGMPAGATVSVDVSTDDGATWVTAAENVTNSGATTGSTVIRMPATTTAQARVRVMPTGNPGEGDVSDTPFTLAAPTVTVTSPNTAAAWRIDQSRPIRWSHNLGALESARLEVSRDDGATWTTLENGVALTTAATENYNWLVTGPVSAAARVRVVWVHEPSVNDASDVPFAIQSGITVTAPNTAVVWGAGTLRTATWTHAYGAAQAFDVAVSVDNGLTWVDVATGVVADTATTGRASVRMPEAVTTQALVRVSPVGRPGDGDVGNVPFQLAAPQLTVTAPNTNVLWTIGSARSITWSHNLGTAEAVDIEISRTGGATWEPLASGVANTANASGSYAWTVSGPASSTALVRVRWVRPVVVTDVSNVTFRIQ